MAPAEIIWASITGGNTSAMPARASVPRCDSHQVSISPVEAWASITSTLGQARRRMVGTIGPCSSIRVRALSAAGAGAAPLGTAGLSARAASMRIGGRSFGRRHLAHQRHHQRRDRQADA